MVGMFVSLCLASKTDFFFSTVMERYSHEGYLIKEVVMALAGEVTRELSPMLFSFNSLTDMGGRDRLERYSNRSYLIK